MVRHNGATSSLSWRFLVALLLFFACCGTYRSVFASDEETEAGAGKLYKIEGRVNGDGSSETIILHGNGGRMSVVPSSNGKFELVDIPAGSYLLEVASNKYVYHPLRVDVSSRQNGKVKARFEENNKQVPYPLDIHPAGPMIFFEERKGFEILSFLKNPMVIMVALPLGVMFLTKMLTGSDAMKQQLAEMAPTPQHQDPTEVVNKWLERDGKKRKKE